MEKVAELICSTVEDRSIMTGILVKNGYTVGPGRIPRKSGKSYDYTLKIYKISRYEVENPDDYDIVLKRTAGYNHSTYAVIKNNTNLSQLELALICDDGNLCFGYTMEGSLFYIFED